MVFVILSVVSVLGTESEYTREQQADMFGLGAASEGLVLDACLVARMIDRNRLSTAPSEVEMQVMRTGPWMAKVNPDIHMRTADILARLGFAKHGVDILGSRCYNLIAPIIGIDVNEVVSDLFGKRGTAKEFAELVCTTLREIPAEDRERNVDRDTILGYIYASMAMAAVVAANDPTLYVVPPPSAPFWRENYAAFVARSVYADHIAVALSDECETLALYRLTTLGKEFMNPKEGDVEVTGMLHAAEEASRHHIEM